MMGFDSAFDKTLGHEGGYSNDSNDPGGETKYGISKRTYPTLDIGGLSLEDAKRIYKRDFWDALSLDRLPERVAEAVFDAAVNSGPRAAAIWLQRALHVVQDGRIGPITIWAANQEKDVSGLLMRFYGHRLSHLSDLNTWPHFGRGWARRVAANLIEESQ